MMDICSPPAATRPGTLWLALFVAASLWAAAPAALCQNAPARLTREKVGEQPGHCTVEVGAAPSMR